jgi:hypothetical protein
MKFGELKEGKKYLAESEHDFYEKRNGGLYHIGYDRYSLIAMDVIMEMDFEEVKEFTEQELTVLNALQPVYKWVARDKDGSVWAYYGEPRKNFSKSNFIVPYNESFKTVYLSGFNLLFRALSAN